MLIWNQTFHFYAFIMQQRQTIAIHMDELMNPVTSFPVSFSTCSTWVMNICSWNARANHYTPFFKERVLRAEEHCPYVLFIPAQKARLSVSSTHATLVPALQARLVIYMYLHNKVTTCLAAGRRKILGLMQRECALYGSWRTRRQRKTPKLSLSGSVCLSAERSWGWEVFLEQEWNCVGITVEL